MNLLLQNYKIIYYYQIYLKLIFKFNYYKFNNFKNLYLIAYIPSFLILFYYYKINFKIFKKYIIN